jgi:hypothetical protein
MRQSLKILGVNVITGSGCKCNPNSNADHNYTLPRELDGTIYTYLATFGTPTLTLERNSMLKIENADVSIMGIRRARGIKLTLKNVNKLNLVDVFEIALENWLERKKE